VVGVAGGDLAAGQAGLLAEVGGQRGRPRIGNRRGLRDGSALGQLAAIVAARVAQSIGPPGSTSPGPSGRNLPDPRPRPGRRRPPQPNHPDRIPVFLQPHAHGACLTRKKPLLTAGGVRVCHRSASHRLRSASVGVDVYAVRACEAAAQLDLHGRRLRCMRTWLCRCGVGVGWPSWPSQ
jgi:hypothetical protein